MGGPGPYAPRMPDPSPSSDPKRHWSGKLAAFLPGFMAAHPVLSRFAGRGPAILDGPITMGIDDEFADLDVWWLLGEADLADVDAAGDTRFFEFELDSRPGHLNADSAGDVRRRLAACDMDLIYQLRRAAVLFDHTGAAAELIALADRPMPPHVRRALFFWHYVEMRGEHRACDNPMERGQPVGVLLSLPKVVRHALQAAMALDGEPFPYDKWLLHAARHTPTGRRIAPCVEKIVDLLGADALRFAGRERDNPISRTLREIRGILIDAARAHGIDEPWLTEWYLHMHRAAQAVRGLRWDQESPPR